MLILPRGKINLLIDHGNTAEMVQISRWNFSGENACKIRKTLAPVRFQNFSKIVLIKKIIIYICSPLEMTGFFMRLNARKADVAQLARAADL